MRVTSIEALEWLRDENLIGKRQHEVLGAVLEMPNSTDRELANYLDADDPNYVRPRRRELEKLGIIKESGERPCFITNRNSKTWCLASFSKKSILNRKKAIKTKKNISEFKQGLIETEKRINSLIKTIDKRFQKTLSDYYD